MKLILPALTASLLLMACTEEQSAKQAEKAEAEIVAEDDAAALKEEQKSIDAAADAAAKLVEEESRAEIEEFQAGEDKAAAEE